MFPRSVAGERREELSPEPGTVGADSGHSGGPLKKTITFSDSLDLGLRVGTLKVNFRPPSIFPATVGGGGPREMCQGQNVRLCSVIPTVQSVSAFELR